MTLRIALLSVAVSLAWPAIAQEEPQVRGRFLTDSIRIGEEAVYVLGATYPQNIDVLFPDSSINTFPFEYARREYFPTVTRNGVSRDSVVYYYRTFEPDSVQTLALPVFVVHERDCTAVYADADSLFLKRILVLPDTARLDAVALKETIAFERIPTSFGWVVASAIAGVVMLLAAGGYAVFGKTIRRHYRMRKLRNNFARFMESYTSNLSRLRESASPEVAESTVSLWKKYLEKLELRPYTKLTTKETIQLIRDDSIRQSLQSIDRSIYGGQTVDVKPFEGLMDFARDKFERKMEEVMHE
ncbi:MAG: hypothetical protein DIU61_008265 [Bacteroidota bacterium]|jgi:hypothetical protein|nr:MAG: hypothetical protein DIU61_13925 [Bacteroidota bacterium]